MRTLFFALLGTLIPLSAWGQAAEHKITASDGASGDRFGIAVALLEDRALVGAEGDDDNGTLSGSAYVFERQPNDSWIETAKLTASDGTGFDYFGHAVSILESHALVGANRDSFSRGTAYIFERQSDGTWLEADKLLASDGTDPDNFGHSVSIHGDFALIGAYVHEEEDMMRRGSAYVFERQSDGSWLEVAELLASDGASDDHFGYSVSLFADRALIGATGDDDGCSNSGSAYVFERQSDGAWLEVTKLTASDCTFADHLGIAASLSGDHALLGAYGDDELGFDTGAAYVFDRQQDGSWLEVAKLTASDAADGDWFGHAVSISEGTRAIVGSRYDDDRGKNSGAAYVFERQSDGSWLEVGKHTASDGASLDTYGASVAISGDDILVGAPDDDDLGGRSGSVYMYARAIATDEGASPDLPQQHSLSPPYPNPFSHSAVVSFEIPEASHVELTLLDMLGREVRTLLNQPVSAGKHNVVVDGDQLSNGPYHLRMVVNGTARSSQGVIVLR